MPMTPEQIRLSQNPVLTSLLLGCGQGLMVAESVFPRLPQALRGVALAKMGDAHLKQYSLRRAPGTATKRIDINYEGKTYTVKQYSVEVPLPRELIQESENARRLNAAANLDVSVIAMTTANAVLGLGYEIEAAGVATDPATYPASHVTALTGAAKWSADEGTPVKDVRAAAEQIRAATGRRPNTLTLAAPVLEAVCTNPEVRSYLSANQMGPATVDQLRTIFNIPNIVVGDAIWKDKDGTAHDVWGNSAILSYAPNIGGNGSSISLAEPAFGFTNVLEGHPFAEQPYFDEPTKSWIFGATYEREVSVAFPEAGFLFQNPA